MALLMPSFMMYLTCHKCLNYELKNCSNMGYSTHTFVFSLKSGTRVQYDFSGFNLLLNTLKYLSPKK